jgi:hypothetical protein
MNRNILYCATTSLLGLGILCSVADAADYAGKYASPQLTVVITPTGTTYAGEIRMGEHTFPLTAHEDGNHLSGVFTSQGSAFSFTATGQGDDLTLVTDGNTYRLHRHPNPLAAVRPANPQPAGGTSSASAPPTQADDALASYVVMNHTDVGRSLVREVPNAKTTRAALQATFPDLARYFGARPTILGSYEDQRDHSSAFVSFSAQLNGQPMKGFVTTKMREQGAVVFVVFGNANATREQWAKLTARPAAANGERDMKAEMADVPLRTYFFPDGTGSIGIADGWTTNAETESHLLVSGPADQKVRMAMGGTVYTPDSMAVRQNMVERLNLAVAPYSDDPATALGYIVRANSVVSQRNGGPTFVPEKIVNVQPVPAKSPGGHGAQITYDVTANERAGVKHYRVLIQFEVSPVRNGTWGYYTSIQLIAPQETFKQDLPVMMAQAWSLKENAAAVGAKSRREIDAANKLAEAQRAANAKIAQAHYDHNKSVAEASARQSQNQRDIDNNETIKLRSITDFDETIRGVRTVEDTQTGEQKSVNLADVHDIVDHLNEQDPGRYREIPLRDEVYPLPGHENDRDYLSR